MIIHMIIHMEMISQIIGEHIDDRFTFSFLSDIDDGAKNAVQSIAMLKESFS